ncbi:T9SS type A sorting domain-containing protein [Hymenobacter busanensis]|uniref:T9SS type A sorting domain-containing protein n=1 Tax=Hymenobacter busanensis TaxID=2607656 RepID=UPI001366D00E|nr:T9SS type A sorting domain-containing protein [Hymenobacter busanensis]QHJ06847.1 T9SS type A sorting domain-containing protein [Hymenobacter busanensis]
MLPTFGLSGVSMQARGVKQQADGRLVVVGDQSNGIILTRLLADGTTDSLFGTAGLGAVSSGGSANLFVGSGLAVQPDGKYVVSGSAGGPGYVARHNPDGSFDTGFGEMTGQGAARTGYRKVIYPGLGNLGGIWYGSIVNPDGSITVAGDRHSLAANFNNNVVHTFSASGDDVAQYGVSTSQLNFVTNVPHYFTDIARLPNGKSMAVGQCTYDFLLSQALPDGSHDSGFGPRGFGLAFCLDINRSAGITAQGIAAQPDGKLVVVGSRRGKAMILRMNSDATLDASFGNQGIVDLTIGSLAVLNKVQVQSDGKIVAVGAAKTATSNNDFVLVRLQSDGSPDPGFGTNGISVTDIGNDSEDVINGLDIQADGKIVVAGYTTPAGSTTKQFIVARYLGTAAALPNGIWTGLTSTASGVATNWSNNVLPAATDNLVFPAGTPNYAQVTGTLNGSSITVAPGATLTLASTGTLTATGTVTNNGTLNLLGTLRMQGTAAQELRGSAFEAHNLEVGPAGVVLTTPLTVHRMLTLGGGLQTDGQPLVLASDASNSAMVVNRGGGITGNVTMQRAITASLNPGTGYRHFSSPVVGAALSGLATNGFTPVLNQAYNTSSNPSTVQPFPNIFEYIEGRPNTATDFDLGWQVPTGTMGAGKGYTVNLPASATVALTGPVNAGPVTIPLNYSGSGNGWNLVGNPYPAPIDWNQVAVPSGVGTALYMYRSSGPYAGTYTSFVNGVGSGSVVPAMQGFFVRALAPGKSLLLDESVRMQSYANPAFYRSGTDTRPQLQLDLSAAGAATPFDVTYVYCEAGATPAADARFDAWKVISTQAGLYTQAGNDALSINGLPALSATSLAVPLVVRVPQAGTYSLSASLLHFPAGAEVKLQDLQTGQQQDLLANSTYTFTETTGTGAAARFLLQLRSSVATATSAKSVSLLGVYPNPMTQGRLHVSLDNVRAAVATVQLLNSLGQVVASEVLPVVRGQVNGLVTAHGAAAGVYTLRVMAGAETMTRKVTIVN